MRFQEPAFQPTYVMTDDRQGDPDDVDDCETIVTVNTFDIYTFLSLKLVKIMIS